MVYLIVTSSVGERSVRFTGARLYRDIAGSWYFDGQEFPRADIVGRWFTTLLWFSVVVGLPEMRGRSVSSQAWPKLVSI